MQDVHAQLASAGLRVDGELEVGRLVRCPVEGDSGRKRSGWYVLHELRLDSGELVLVGRYGNWRAGTPLSGLAVEFEAGGLSDEERRRMKEAAQQARERAIEEKRERAEQAAARAANIWPKLPESGKSEYLQRKGVRAYGVRFTRGSIVVPVRNGDGDLLGLQWIGPGGDKTFLTGTPKQACFHLIGEVGADVGVLGIAEGYATAAEVHEVVGWPVAVAFDAGNLLPVARVLRSLHPDIEIVLLGDRDEGKTPGWGCYACGWFVQARLGERENPRYQEPAACPECGRADTGSCGPGEVKASAAARYVAGRVVIPDFSVTQQQGEDAA